ncbi:Stp1/IreP family PP2C-type Ser/Thr phosphatase [Bacillus taeanensis]|uniref:protein-serine/threonine phosphatase n=1 Tax=Bacillus taeanensis TaxID=273032 RepID=A0A366XRW4_9BACI|nr:Stp1/IreP family PP2C-type Ser/Thr phosphatase [Bacillus taeanensis]RBW67509.1 Stp1/IreP family PP2C-type Ser/Thr phosphatase [Bacillus taeanensis]
METVFKTDKGKVRPHNEDSGGIFIKNNQSVLAVVADGMGGHRAGDVASTMAVSFLKEKWEHVNEVLTPHDAEKWLEAAILGANQKILDYAKNHPECKGMGTTLAAALCTEQYIIIAHIGDSRIYLLNENAFSLKTSDHSLVNELLKSGEITEEEASNHPRKHVLLRALGTEESIYIDIQTVLWEEDDLLLLCSDGLTNKVSDETLEEMTRSEYSLDEMAVHLIQLANKAGGEDNISVALLKHSSDHKSKGEG